MPWRLPEKRRAPRARDALAGIGARPSGARTERYLHPSTACQRFDWVARLGSAKQLGSHESEGSEERRWRLSGLSPHHKAGELPRRDTVGPSQGSGSRIVGTEQSLPCHAGRGCLGHR